MTTINNLHHTNPQPAADEIAEQPTLNSQLSTLNSKDFPILGREVYGKPLVYLDNAATTQKPRCVVEAMSNEYYNVNANVHRGVHYLSQQATELHEGARETVRRFINAASTAEVIFTRGTTESINLVAATLASLSPNPSPVGRGALAAGWNVEDMGSKSPLPTGEGLGERLEVIVSTLEHHSNIVPWQLAGFKLRVIPMLDDCTLDLSALDNLFTPRTAIVSVAHISNVTGTVNPIEHIIERAHAHGVPVLIDAAQSAPHCPIDVQALDCDFLAFSAHKMYGPTGIGVLYGKREWLDRLPPYMGGGEMIKNVSFERTTYNELPYKFEAGTPDYIATTGLAHAIDYITAIGLDNIARHEHQLLDYAIRRLQDTFPSIQIYSPAANSQLSTLNSSAVISFNFPGIHHLDIGTLLDRLGIAVRTGHHCAEPLMHRLGVEGTVRASLALYNTTADIDALVAALQRIVKMF